MRAVITQSLIPFLLYLLIQIPVFFVGMSLFPRNHLQEWSGKTAVKTYINGQMLVWAVFQIMAVPMIMSRQKFDVLFYSFIIAIIALCAIGCMRWIRLKKSGIFSCKDILCKPTVLSVILMIAVVVLILLQFFTYYFGQHLDEDDARWLAETNDALAYGDMMTRYASTGEYLGWFETVRDVTSPWPMFFAVIAKLLHVNAAVGEHTLYAPVALMLSYGVYYLIASELFEKTESRLVFLMSVAVINLFYAGTVYTQSVFTLVRIWQGKASVAAIIIPFLIYLAICINKRDEVSDWLQMVITCCAACLLSGMGVSMSGILVFVFGIYSILVYRRWNRIPIWLLTMTPTVVFSALFLYLRG